MTPTVIIHIRGGVVTCISADTAMRAIVLDHDLDGCDADLITGDGDEAAVADVQHLPSDPEDVAYLCELHGVEVGHV